MLTAMKQEVTRKHKAEKWALDDVVYHTEVTSYERMEQVNTSMHLTAQTRLFAVADAVSPDSQLGVRFGNNR